MYARRILFGFLFMILLAFSTACNKMDRLQLDQAKSKFKAGQLKAAAGDVNQVLGRSPRNIFAKRLLKKIEEQLMQQIREDLDAGRYTQALKKTTVLLNDVHSEREEAKALQAEARKYLTVEAARKSLEADSPGKALTLAEDALKLDPQFKEAKEVKEQASQRLQEKIANLMNIAQKLIAEKKYKELQKQANDILAQDPQNKEATKLLHEATAQLLIQDKELNLKMAREFYKQGIFESAKARAEKVLKVDPSSIEAKKIVQNANAEIRKPTLRLTGFTKIKGKEYAHLEIPKTRERFMVTEGERFAQFKVSAIDLDLKAVVVTYIRTGSQQTLTTREE